MTKRNGRNGRNGQGSAGGAGSQSSGRGHDAETFDLLEIGPEDENDLLEFEGTSNQKATIKV
ncbi:MAG TPA: hypothetical protein ENO23_08820, partial [Alphaproteobacteria bacterium]|nr:hypothetical protein [Alphaproteobacteria bacterium]